VQQLQTLGAMNNGISIFREEAQNVQQTFPTLTCGEMEDGIPFVIGDLILEDEQGGFVDSYSIRIEPTENYPLRFPHVYETGGRLPVNVEWHMMPEGNCCIKAFPEEILLCKQGINLYSFIEKEVRPYFFNQKHREIHGFFLNERSHGLVGNIEFLEEIFQTKNLNVIIRGLLLIKDKREPDRVSKCFCGSGLKYRKCHREAFRKLNLFTDDELKTCIQMVLTFKQYISRP
jgi:hypothetical protein